MNINLAHRLPRNKKKVYYTLEWGKARGQRMSTGVYTYLEPKDQIQRNHNKEALMILESKRSQMVLDRQAINSTLNETKKAVLPVFYLKKKKSINSRTKQFQLLSKTKIY